MAEDGEAQLGALPEAPVVVVRNTFIDFEGLPQILEGCSWGKKARSCPTSPMASTARVGGPPAEALVGSFSFFNDNEEDLRQLEPSQSAEKCGSEAKSNFSVGSAGHAARRCKPCAFYHADKGCANGQNCTFCHLCEPGEKKRRQKQKWERKRRFMQNRQAAAAAAAVTAVAASPADAIMIVPSVLP